MFSKLSLLMASASCYEATWEGGPTFDIFFNTGNKKLTFEVSVPENQWLGISFERSMSNVDQVVFSGDGSVTDLWSTGYKQPDTDKSQDFTPNYGDLYDGEYLFSSDRDLNTGDSQDMAFECGQSYEMAWTGNKNTSDLQYHTDKGEFTLYLGSDCTVGINEKPIIKEEPYNPREELEWEEEEWNEEWEKEPKTDPKKDEPEWEYVDPEYNEWELIDPYYPEDYEWDMPVEIMEPDFTENWDYYEDWAQDELDNFDADVSDWSKEAEVWASDMESEAGSWAQDLEEEWAPEIKNWGDQIEQGWNDVSARDSSAMLAFNALFAASAFIVYA